MTQCATSGARQLISQRRPWAIALQKLVAAPSPLPRMVLLMWDEESPPAELVVVVVMLEVVLLLVPDDVVAVVEVEPAVLLTLLELTTWLAVAATEPMVVHNVSAKAASSFIMGQKLND